MVERAPLRPVPRRPGGPVEPEPALRHVAARLPELDPLPLLALALVTLAGRTRAEAAARAGVEAHELGEALARARKELRRSVEPMAASGWCERAERLISDRLDGELDEPGAARLDVHLRNCPRCVEHERRLVQAIDLLVGGLVGEPQAAPSEPAPLKLAEARAERAPAPSLHMPAIASRPFGEPIAPAARRSAPRRAAETPALDPPETSREAPAPLPRAPESKAPARAPSREKAMKAAASTAATAPEKGPKVLAPPAAAEPAPPAAAEPRVGVVPERAVEAALEPVRRSARELAVAATWQVLFALAVLLAIATIAITVWGATGGRL